MQLNFEKIDCNLLSDKIKSSLQFKCEDTLLNHFKTLFHRRYNCGFVSDEKFIIWDYNHRVGIFYPVIKGNFNLKSNSVTISTSINVLGKIFYILITLGFIYAMIPLLFYNDAFFLNKILLLIILICLPSLAIYLSYNTCKKNMLSNFKKTINTFSIINE